MYIPMALNTFTLLWNHNHYSFPELFHLPQVKLYPLKTNSHSPPPSSGNHCSNSCVFESAYFLSLHIKKLIQYLSFMDIFFFLAYYRSSSMLQRMSEFTFFLIKGWTIFHCVHISQFVIHSLMKGWGTAFWFFFF